MKSFSISQALAAFAFLSLAAAGAAHADDVFTARLQAPTTEARVVARSAVWTCEGEVCRARPNHAASVSACRALVREVGAVSAYGPEAAPLSDEQLSACNASARAARDDAQSEHAAN
ncbi:MAG: hypothetical protein AB7O04_03965 [Hyphomonadaceae bacterium]